MMNKTDILANVTRVFHKSVFQLKKHSPEIMVVAGTIGMVGAAVMACKATTKVSTILDDAKKTVNDIHEVSENPTMADKYSKEDADKDLAITYVQTGVKLAKLYGPAVLLGTASVMCILGGHNILRKRNAALAVAYATVDNGFKEYRSRVVERFGEALDRELRYDIKAKEVEEVVVDENGEEQVIKSTVEVANVPSYSHYARFFDECCADWTKNAESNLFFLKCQQDTANRMLKTRGHLFLNEVYDLIGLNRSQEGNIVGWIYDEKNPIGDNYVDFGIFNIHDGKARDFVNGRERSILLDFNVDGDIWSLMK